MNIRILIVEDEIFELTALQYEIHTLYPDKLEIFTAQDGIHALSVCQYERPDILLVDLNIPGLSGLELIRTLSEHQFSGKILITTAHDCSQYVREAMSLGVIDYLLKPLKQEQLKLSIDRCMKKLQEDVKQQQLKQGLLSAFSYVNTYLIRDILSDHAPENALCSVYGWPEDGELQICLISWHNPDISAEDVAAYVNICSAIFEEDFHQLSTMENGSVLLLLQARECQPMDYLRVKVYCGLLSLTTNVKAGTFTASPIFSSYHALYLYASDLRVNAGKRREPLCVFLSPYGEIYSAKERIQLRQKLVQKLREGQTASMIAYLKKKLLQPDAYWPVLAVFLDAVFLYDSSADMENLMQIFRLKNPWPQFEEWLKHLYMRQTAKSSSGSISTALEIMRQRYGEDLSLGDVATEIGLSQSYFSHLFKRERGKSFVQELNELRISHALQLLSEKKTNIEKISAQCGYNSRKYFNEAFKRITGCSVMQYLREEQENDTENHS